MAGLLLLFIGVPALELWLLIEIGQRIGTLETLALIVVTGVVGASLARRQGLQVLATVQRELAEGQLPGSALIDGMLILLASALLVTPGILTDAVGFLCLLPLFRRLLRRSVARWLERSIEQGTIQVQSVHFENSGLGRRVIDVTPRGSDDQPRGRKEP